MKYSICFSYCYLLNIKNAVASSDKKKEKTRIKLELGQFVSLVKEQLCSNVGL